MQSQLSKSEYMMFLKHPAWVWLKKHDKTKLPPVDANTQAVFDTGNLFESYAEARFPKGVRLGFNDYNEYRSLPDRTASAIASGEKTLFQARFEAGRYTCITDVIDRVGESTFDLYEIKSSTGVKADHILDLAFQVMVMELAGYTIRHIYVIYVNKSYVRKGEIDFAKMTAMSEVTEEVRAKHKFTLREAAAALKTIDLPAMPDPSPAHCQYGSLSEWLAIYRTLVAVPSYSIYDLASPGTSRLGQLEQKGISLIADIPAEIDVTEKQALQVKATKTNEPLIEYKKIARFLDGLSYPLYFLDYETLGSLVPPFDGLRPYQQLPFQYSLHILESPNGELLHREYLHTERTNPAAELTESLKADIGPVGTVLAWYADFEIGCNNMLADLLPEHAPWLTKLNQRVQDLMLPFASGWYVDKDFFGSASIKKVLPVLVPELSYKDLDIQEGQGAQRLWMSAVLDDNPEIDKTKLFTDLIQYCGLDTMAMVEIYRFLLNLGKASSPPVQTTLPL